ncbi:MAG: C69 family dipeptidase [Sedimentisphaerales bacterium]|nr:C69 family dipeptidase [Sedimentisphaerales bacterium]
MIMKNNFPGTLFFVGAIILSVLFFAPAKRCQGCFAVVVGKDASTDGGVIIAHNEDDNHPQVVNHYKVPRKKHASGEKVTLRNGGELEQVEETWSYIWSEMPGMLFSDGYVNEWGVSIISDMCPSKEDKPELTDGGIGYMLRRLVAQRAKTSRKGVLLAGELVERFGYIYSGRTYIICDPDEGWLFHVVKGKHWLARRVPDNEVAMIANTYTTHSVDLSDKDNFLASDDIIEYAILRGWYNPQKDGPFDFAGVYADPESAAKLSNQGRQWSGMRYVATEAIPLRPELPFSVVPKHKLGVTDVMRIMRDHYEGTELQSPSGTANPHQSSGTICNDRTQTSIVIQLRKGMPLDIGVVYWACLASPCVSTYIPFYFGIADFPAGYCSRSQQPSEDFYKTKVDSPFRVDPFDAFWTFSSFREKIDKVYRDKITGVRTLSGEVENRALSLQKPLEKTAVELYKKDKTAAMQLLSNYSKGIYLSALEVMNKTFPAE